MQQLSDYILEKQNFLVKKHINNQGNKSEQDEILNFIFSLMNIDKDNPVKDDDDITKWEIKTGKYVFPSQMIDKLYEKFGKENFGWNKGVVWVQICRDEESSYLIWYKNALPVQIRWVSSKEKYIIRYNKEQPDDVYDTNL